jgi:hypothetical protein
MSKARPVVPSFFRQCGCGPSIAAKPRPELWPIGEAPKEVDWLSVICYLLSAIGYYSAVRSAALFLPMLHYSHPPPVQDSGVGRQSPISIVFVGLMALLGVSLIFLFPGSPEQDSGYHFAMAQAAWREPAYFVKVWARPLYTLAFAGPALGGLQTARFCALAISLLIAWQTWKLARDLRLERTWLIVPLLFAQPTFFELFTDLLTEPIFALTFVIALRLHLLGRVKLGMLVASLLPLARPEGAFLCLLWGTWVLTHISHRPVRNAHEVPIRRRRIELNREGIRPGKVLPKQLARGALLTSSKTCEKSRLSSSLPVFRQSFAPSLAGVAWLLLLGTGTSLWWIAAFTITGDPLFIVHDWPRQWQNGTYGHDSIFGYAERAWEFTGPLLIPFLLLGLVHLLWRRKHGSITSAWLLFFVLHSVFRAFGLFGEAGYPRYMVSMAPATVILTLVGWNAVASWRTEWWRNTRLILGVIIIAGSLLASFLYLDSLIWSRDFGAIREMVTWFDQNHRTVRRFIWSDIGMCIQTKRNIIDAPPLTADRERNLRTLRDAPSQTLVFWDDNVGPKWFGLTWREIESAGYQVLRIRQYTLPGLLVRGEIGGWQLTRKIELSLLYKP